MFRALLPSVTLATCLLATLSSCGGPITPAEISSIFRQDKTHAVDHGGYLRRTNQGSLLGNLPGTLRYVKPKSILRSTSRPGSAEFQDELLTPPKAPQNHTSSAGNSEELVGPGGRMTEESASPSAGGGSSTAFGRQDIDGSQSSGAHESSTGLSMPQDVYRKTCEAAKRDSIKGGFEGFTRGIRLTSPPFPSNDMGIHRRNYVVADSLIPLINFLDIEAKALSAKNGQSREAWMQAVSSLAGSCRRSGMIMRDISVVVFPIALTAVDSDDAVWAVAEVTSGSSSDELKVGALAAITFRALALEATGPRKFDAKHFAALIYKSYVDQEGKKPTYVAHSGTLLDELHELHDHIPMNIDEAEQRFRMYVQHLNSVEAVITNAKLAWMMAFRLFLALTQVVSSSGAHLGERASVQELASCVMFRAHAMASGCDIGPPSPFNLIPVYLGELLGVFYGPKVFDILTKHMSLEEGIRSSAKNLGEAYFGEEQISVGTNTEPLAIEQSTSAKSEVGATREKSTQTNPNSGLRSRPVRLGRSVSRPTSVGRLPTSLSEESSVPEGSAEVLNGARDCNNRCPLLGIAIGSVVGDCIGIYLETSMRGAIRGTRARALSSLAMLGAYNKILQQLEDKPGSTEIESSEVVSLSLRMLSGIIERNSVNAHIMRQILVRAFRKGLPIPMSLRAIHAASSGHGGRHTSLRHLMVAHAPANTEAARAIWPLVLVYRHDWSALCVVASETARLTHGREAGTVGAVTYALALQQAAFETFDAISGRERANIFLERLLQKVHRLRANLRGSSLRSEAKAYIRMLRKLSLIKGNLFGQNPERRRSALAKLAPGDHNAVDNVALALFVFLHQGVIGGATLKGCLSLAAVLSRYPSDVGGLIGGLMGASGGSGSIPDSLQRAAEATEVVTATVTKLEGLLSRSDLEVYHGGPYFQRTRVVYPSTRSVWRGVSRTVVPYSRSVWRRAGRYFH